MGNQTGIDQQHDTPGSGASVAIVVPVCNEAEALRLILPGLVELAAEEGMVISVGVNGSTDESFEVAREFGVVAAEVSERGYGWGCMAGIRALAEAGERPDGYLFVAGDGANTESDIRRLIKEWRTGKWDLILGERTLSLGNWRSVGASRALPNLTLGALCSVLTGQLYLDLGALRIVSRWMYEVAEPEEMTWGWTAEAQIIAARLGARILRVQVTEQPRKAGEQKVSGVSWRRSLKIGLLIASACWRVRQRELLQSKALRKPGREWPRIPFANQENSTGSEIRDTETA